MKNRTILLIVCLLVLRGISNGQTSCSPQNFYKTNFVNDGKDSFRLPLRLHFIITADSMILEYDKSKREFLAFRIMDKKCFWNEDFSEGKSIYKLMLGDIRGNKFPTLNIIGNKGQPVVIELLYENAEKRVFYQL